MLQTLLSITSLGAIARRAIAQAQDATVWGVTSRGIFLHLSSGWIIFLSNEQFRGPLTLNSNLSSRLFQNLRPGLTVNMCSNRLIFKTLEIEVDTDSAVIWSALAPSTVSPANLAGRFDRLKSIYRKVRAARGDTISGKLLSDSMIAGRPEISQITPALENYLGLGEGLTPAGDDLVLGFLLAINRWGDLLFHDLDVHKINIAIQQTVYQKTNTLSANLIECASLGQADERLVLALDGILTGEPDPETCITHLLSWGHTSGANALTGMTLAITGQMP